MSKKKTLLQIKINCIWQNIICKISIHLKGLNTEMIMELIFTIKLRLAVYISVVFFAPRNRYANLQT
jgi:hypothetical protein